MEKNELKEIKKELIEIKELLKQLLEAQVQTNDNVVEIGEEITDTMETMMIIKK